MSAFSNSPKPILFLTNNENTKTLQCLLQEQGERITVHGEMVTMDFLKEVDPVCIISFNYRHILGATVLERMRGRAYNVHCSLLPFNRGANPNFFSFFENTPKGVTVHEMSENLDKGGIVLQSELPMTDSETFNSSYAKLIDEATVLVSENWSALRDSSLEPRCQQEGGSYHSVLDFERIRHRYPFSWSDSVADWKKRYGLE